MKKVNLLIKRSTLWKREFRTKQVIRMFPSLTLRQIQYWHETGLVVPLVRNGKTFNPKLNREVPDRHRTYRYAQVLILGVFANLMDQGMSIYKVRKVASRINRVIAEIRQGKKNFGHFHWNSKKVYLVKIIKRIKRGRP